jgi:hypothetical protein
VTARRVLAGVAALAIGAVAVAVQGKSERPSAIELQRCEALGEGRLSTARVEVRVDGNRVPRCSEHAPATRVLLGVHAALELVPRELDPGPISVELAPRSGAARIVARPETRSLLVSSRFADAPPSVWLHETAHLVFRGSRPRPAVARRLALAIEEGVADYFAAVIARTPIVGEGLAEARDLRHPPAVSAESWAMLGLPGFDPHYFGWDLGARLYSAAPGGGALLDDFARCLQSDVLANADTPGAVLLSLIEGCAAGSRDLREAALRGWAPGELFSEPNNP